MKRKEVYVCPPEKHGTGSWESYGMRSQCSCCQQDKDTLELKHTGKKWEKYFSSFWERKETCLGVDKSPGG